MPDEPIADELPIETEIDPGDSDLESEAASVSEKLAELQSRMDARDREKSDGVRREKIREQVTSVLSDCGLSVDGVRHLIKSIGLAGFGVDEDSGVVTVSIDGQDVPVADGLPVHPLVQAMIRSGGHAAVKSPIVVAQQRIAELEKEKAEIQRSPYRAQNHMLIRFAAVNKAIKEQQAIVDSHTPKKKAGIVDPALLLEHKSISTRMEALGKQYESSRGRDDYALAEFGKLSRRKKEIEKQIESQRG